VLKANAVYQAKCFLGSALARCLIAQELVRTAREEGCSQVAHSAASKGNDQIRMEIAIAAQDPRLTVLAPVRQWKFSSLEDKLSYAVRHRVDVGAPAGRAVSFDRNLWGVSVFLPELSNSWQEPPASAYTLTRSPEKAPSEPAIVTISFESGVPTRLGDRALGPIALVQELNRLGAEHGIGRSDVIEDRLFGIKSRELYETPAATLLLTAHRDLEYLVQSRELIHHREALSRRYAELVYMGLWFHDLRRALESFFNETQRNVTGAVRLKLYKGSCTILGRQSPHSLYDNRLTTQTNLEWFDDRWVQGFTSLWTLPSRLAAQQRSPNDPASG
jgi:argininosuccinate synthase